MAPATASGDDSDVLEGGSEHPLFGPSVRVGLGVTAAALVGMLIGYAVGNHRSTTDTTRSTMPSASVSPPDGSAAIIGPAFAQTGATCSIQQGHRLQLGIQIVNQAPSVLHITKVVTVDPLRGLRPIAAQVGACGQDRGTQIAFDPSAVPAGGATWVNVTVQVLVRCPAPDPVQFVIHYGQGERTGVADLAGFVDLSNVPYSGCAR
ncbi:MAG TPA: hypothetical protein VHW74_07200 [Mycobacteriales bacterium]|nr:hypothetical protein [Mycobacteriales bacterium]